MIRPVIGWVHDRSLPRYSRTSRTVARCTGVKIRDPALELLPIFWIVVARQLARDLMPTSLYVSCSRTVSRCSLGRYELHGDLGIITLDHEDNHHAEIFHPGAQ
jgi:hypothetical protein